MEKLTHAVIGGSNGMGRLLARFLEERNLLAAYADQEQGPHQAPFFPENRRAAQAAEVVWLAVPIRAMSAVLEEIWPDLAGKILVDVCSVKVFVVEQFQALQNSQPQEVAYLSLHPMFGGDVRNLQGHGFVETFANPPAEAYQTALRHLFEKEGALWYQMGYRQHDRIMAVIQSLNHFNIFVSARTVYDLEFSLQEFKDLASPAYRIFLVFFTRYVLSNPRLYAQIQFYNRESVPVIEAFKKEVDRLHALVANQDEAGFVDYIEQMKPFYEQNAADRPLSRQLIQRLGELLAEQDSDNPSD